MSNQNNNEFLFHERQRFDAWWIWLILIGINVMTWYALWSQIYLKQPIGDNEMSDFGLILVASLLLAITLFMRLISLETSITNEGIDIRFFPLIFRKRHFSWNSIKHAHVRTYAPIREYGGWGLRYGWSGRGKAYNVSGNQGLQIEFMDGKKLLIGTKKPTELREVIQKMNLVYDAKRP